MDMVIGNNTFTWKLQFIVNFIVSLQYYIYMYIYIYVYINGMYDTFRDSSMRFFGLIFGKSAPAGP